MKGSYLGPGFSQQEIESRLTTLGAKFIAHTDEELVDACGNALVDEKALVKVKYRDSFRPFAPSVLREDVADWFELGSDSPYMLLVADVVERRRKPMTREQEKLFEIEKLNVARIDTPAVTRVDYSARILTEHRETNPRYHASRDSI